MGYVQPVPGCPGHDFPKRPSAGAVRPTSTLRAAVAAACMVAGLAAPRTAEAQLSPFLVELRGGATVPSGDFLDAGTAWDGAGGEATTLGADFTLVWAGRWAWYAGFGQDRYRCPAETCEGEDELVATGFDLGLRVLLRRDARVVPWIGGGALSYRVERHRSDAASVVTPRAWGWEAGAGVYLVLAESLYLNPSARFRSLDTDRDGPGELAIRAVVVDLGLVVAF